jgi:long-subunit fatty acid transport protein
VECVVGAILASFATTGSVIAGSLTTSGQGARALAMGGAFTAVADDASAVYYNPAGIIQAPRTELMAGVAAGAPDVEYHARGAVQRNTRNRLAPWLFATRRLTDRLAAGVGVYSPFARDAAFDADPARLSGATGQHLPCRPRFGAGLCGRFAAVPVGRKVGRNPALLRTRIHQRKSGNGR